MTTFGSRKVIDMTTFVLVQLSISFCLFLVQLLIWSQLFRGQFQSTFVLRKIINMATIVSIKYVHVCFTYTS